MTKGRRAYITYFDQRYPARAVIMISSLRRHDPSAEIFALCFDQPARTVISALADPMIEIIAPETIYSFDPHLATCSYRDRWPFYATHKPVLPLYVFKRRPDLVSIVHIDADMQLFSSPLPLFDEIGEASIALSPLRFSFYPGRARSYGEFDAGFIYWRNDATGLRCLADYRVDCLAWCEPRPESGGRFMNQGYLTSWPKRYPKVHIIQHPGVDLAPWNVAARRLEHAENNVFVDGRPLVLFHFSNLFRDSSGWRTGYSEFGNNLDRVQRWIYCPYIEQLEQTQRWIDEFSICLSAEPTWTSETSTILRP
jgi:hypothetical protein